jgi:peptidoglycan DL-endopeptidase CwlO
VDLPAIRKGRYRLLLAVLAAALMVLAGPASAGLADPVNPDGPANTLEGQLTEIGRQLTDAQDRMAAAEHQQVVLKAQVVAAQMEMQRLLATIGGIANAEYRTGGAATLNALLGASSPADFMRRATALHEIAQSQNAELVEFRRVQADFTAKKNALDQQIAIAQAQAAKLNQQKQAALKILNHASGGPSGVVIAAATADPAPRNSDGSFPAQSCNQNDPTTSGCLTARTLHAYQQVKKAGFNHFVSCWRQQSWGEHPKGRACDWAAAPGGFGGTATGADRDYGNRLAGWLIGNADRLGVLYVIWFKEIWLPGVGWHAYTTEGGNPSGWHTNHVHMSIR